MTLSQKRIWCSVVFKFLIFIAFLFLPGWALWRRTTSKSMVFKLQLLRVFCYVTRLVSKQEILPDSDYTRLLYPLYVGLITPYASRISCAFQFTGFCTVGWLWNLRKVCFSMIQSLKQVVFYSSDYVLHLVWVNFITSEEA